MTGKGTNHILLILSAAFGSLFWQGTTKQKIPVEAGAVQGVFDSNWKTYTNPQLGISFQYPNNWIKNGDGSNAISSSGKIMSTMVGFTDTVSHSVFFIEYHHPPFGASIFKDAQNQMRSSAPAWKKFKETQVAGMKAVESSYTMNSDIKGNMYDPALRISQIIFLDKRGTGAFVLQFKTPLPGSEKEFKQFKKLLASFKFLR